MKAETDPRQLIRAMVVGHHHALEDSIRVVREKRTGKDAAFLFFWKGTFNPRYACVELLNADARYVRNGPLYRDRGPGMCHRRLLSGTGRERLHD